MLYWPVGCERSGGGGVSPPRAPAPALPGRARPATHVEARPKRGGAGVARRQRLADAPLGLHLPQYRLQQRHVLVQQRDLLGLQHVRLLEGGVVADLVEGRAVERVADALPPDVFVQEVLGEPGAEVALAQRADVGVREPALEELLGGVREGALHHLPGLEHLAHVPQALLGRQRRPAADVLHLAPPGPQREVEDELRPDPHGKEKVEQHDEAGEPQQREHHQVAHELAHRVLREAAAGSAPPAFVHPAGGVHAVPRQLRRPLP